VDLIEAKALPAELELEVSDPTQAKRGAEPASSQVGLPARAAGTPDRCSLPVLPVRILARVCRRRTRCPFLPVEQVGVVPAPLLPVQVQLERRPPASMLPATPRGSPARVPMISSSLRLGIGRRG